MDNFRGCPRSREDVLSKGGMGKRRISEVKQRQLREPFVAGDAGAHGGQAGRREHDGGGALSSPAAGNYLSGQGRRRAVHWGD